MDSEFECSEFEPRLYLIVVRLLNNQIASLNGGIEMVSPHSLFRGIKQNEL